MKFFKYQGLGNDFIIIEDLSEQIRINSSEIKKICHRHFGIGADGLIIARPSEKADFYMSYFNADGTQAEMCGNGIRCLAKFLDETGKVNKDELSIETLAGIKILKLFRQNSEIKEIEVNMGSPRFRPEEIPIEVEGNEVFDFLLSVNKKNFLISAVSMGNPHCVIEVKKLDNSFISTTGPKIENHRIFPQRTNVEFMKIVSSEEIEVKVWERGVGETLACGTGACAAAVIAIKKGEAKSPVKVKLTGGTLTITWSNQEDVLLRGPAEKVFHGEIKF